MRCSNSELGRGLGVVLRHLQTATAVICHVHMGHASGEASAQLISRPPLTSGQHDSDIATALGSSRSGSGEAVAG